MRLILALIFILFSFSASAYVTKEDINTYCTDLSTFVFMVSQYKERYTEEQALTALEQVIKEQELNQMTADNLRKAISYVYKNSNAPLEEVVKQYYLGCVNFYMKDVGLRSDT